MYTVWLYIYCIFLADGKQKTERISDGSDAVVILSSTVIYCYALDYYSNFRASWTNVHAQLVIIGCSMFLTTFSNQDCIFSWLNYLIFISFTDHGDFVRCGCIFCEFDFLLDHRKDLTFNVSLCKIITGNL